MAHPILTRELDYNLAEKEIGLSAYERGFVERNRKYHAGTSRHVRPFAIALTVE